MAQVETLTSSETMGLKRTIEVSIASLREDYAKVHPRQIWMLAICVKRTHGELMPLIIQIGRLCKPLSKTTRYLMNREPVLKDFLHPSVPRAHKVPIYWNLRSRFQNKSLCQKSSPLEISHTLRKEGIASILLRLVLSHSKLNHHQFKIDSTRRSNGNMTIRDSHQSN